MNYSKVYRVTWYSIWVGDFITFTTYTSAENEEVAARHTRNQAASKAPWLSPEQIIVTDVQMVKMNAARNNNMTVGGK